MKKILSNINVIKGINIYIKKNEFYGIYSISNLLVDALYGHGYSTKLIRVNYLELASKLIQDRRANNMSILCLEFGLFGFINRKNSVYFLHGFPNLKNYKLINFISLFLLQKISCKLCRFTLSNSLLTSTINSIIFNIKSDDIWNPLLSNILIDMPKNSRHNILYAGRVLHGKGVYEALLAFLGANIPVDWTFTIVGEIFDSRVNAISRDNNRIRLVGHVVNTEISKFYKDASIFISLNPLEPFGVVFYEALCSGLSIITTRYAGAVPYLESLNAKLELIDECSVHLIKSSLEAAISKISELEAAISKISDPNSGAIDV